MDAKQKKIVVGVAVVSLIAAGAVAAYFIFIKKSKTSSADPQKNNRKIKIVRR